MKTPDKRRGSVFIIVLVVCLGLVSLTIVFGHSMVMAYRGEETALAGREAEQAIQGAVRYAEYLMANTDTPGYLPDSSDYQSEAVPVGDAAFWFIGEPLSSSATDAPSFGLVDEASKLNLNTASVAMLENLPNMTPDLAQAIVSWRSANAATSATASTSKGGPFESVDELAQVNEENGGDPAILYGDDLNLNHVLDAGENSGGGNFNPGLFEYVTVFSREPNTLPDGTRRADVTQSSAALLPVLTSAFGSSRAQAIIRRLGGGSVRSVLEFYIRGGLTEAELDEVTPKLTMGGGTFKTGLIDVNTASAAVLQCVPGITQALATQLVSARQNQAAPYTNLAWVSPILGTAASVQAGPYLTTQSFQWTADVGAVGRYGRGYRRTLFVIDSSTGAPQIVYRRNLASLGWALGPAALQNLGQAKVMQ